MALSDLVDAPTLIQRSLPSSGLVNIVPPSDITHENLFSAFSSPTAGLLTVTRDVLLVGRAKPDCLEGGTHEETLRPQVNPKSSVERFKETEVLSRLPKDPRIR